MPGSNHTKLILAQSLQDLMVSIPLEKISVNDIVERAGVGRNTFYYHFEDKYDLVNWYFQMGMTRFLATRSDYSDFASLLSSIEEYLRENQVFYRNALGYNGQNSLQECIFFFIRSLYIQRLRQASAEIGEDIPENDLNFYGDYLAGGILALIMRWYETGQKEHFADYLGCIQRLQGGNLPGGFFAPSP